MLMQSYIAAGVGERSAGEKLHGETLKVERK
jgi:hypothetical protein